MNLSPSWVSSFEASGFSALHWSSVGRADALDSEVLVFARQQTGKTPEQRLEDHKRGYKSNKYAEKYGVRLALEFLERANPMTYDQSCAEEERLWCFLVGAGSAAAVVVARRI
jgi:hypothetical protein